MMNHKLFIKFKDKSKEGYLSIDGSIAEIEDLKTEIMLLNLHQAKVKLSWLVSDTGNVPSHLKDSWIEFEKWQEKPPASDELTVETTSIAEFTRAISRIRMMPTMFCNDEDKHAGSERHDIRFRSDAFGHVCIEIQNLTPCLVAIHYEKHITVILAPHTTSRIQSSVEQIIESEPEANRINALKKLFDGELLLNP